MGDADRPSALELSLKDASHAENLLILDGALRYL